MAYDYNKAKEAYQSLTKEQQQQFVDQNKNDANFQRFMKDYVSEVNQNMSSRSSVNNTPAVQPTQQSTEQPTQTTPEVKQETVVKQEETAGSTVPEIQQQGALKPLSQDYYNQTSSNALDVIKNNLNSYKQSNPEYFNNYKDYKKNFSYNSRNQEQKDVLDNFYNQYQKWLTLSSTPVNDLYTQYKDGQISLADLELLKWNNPAKYAELQNQINKASILTAYDDTTPTEKMNFQDIAYQMIANSLNMINSGDYGASKYFSQLEEKMNSPEMMELQDKTTEINEAYKNIEDQISGIAKDVEKEYEWTWATKSKINAIIADRTYDLQQQLRTLWNEYNKYATQYNNRATQYQNEFWLQLQEYQVNMQARKQQIDELWFAIDLMNFETNEQKQQREWDYWVKQQEYTNWNINSKDYDTRYKAALKSVQNLLSQYEWIPMQRSAEQMAQDILTAIDNGSDLWTELTKLNKQIQGKPEYKYLYNNTFKSSTTWGIGKTYKIWDTEYVDYNGQLYTAEEFNKQFWGKTSSKAYNSVSSEAMSTWLDKFTSNLSKYKGYGWQCAKFVNDYLAEIWVGRYFGTEDAKTRAGFSNTDTPTVWSIAIFDYNQASDDWKNYGHVGIVADITQSGDLIILDSNFWKDGKIQYRTVNPNSASLKWFFDPTIPYGWANTEGWTETENWTQTSTSTITDSDIISFNDKTLNRKLSDENRQRIAEARNKVYSDPNASIEDILRFSQWWDSVTDATVQSFDKYGQALTSLWQLTDLLEDTSTWPILWALRSKNPYDKKAREIETAIAWLLPTLARWVYGEVWVLTDKDIEHYSKTVPNLKSTNDVNDAVLAMSLDMLASGYKRKLQNQAALWKDVSGMAWVYYQIVNESDRIKKKIWIDWTQSTTTTRWKNMSSFLETPEKWISSLPKASDVFKVNTNVGWSNVPSNFF